MQDLDFLPADVKQRRIRRHGRSWQVILIAAAVGLLIVVAIGQARTLRQIRERVARMEPERKMLDARQVQLDQLRGQLARAEAQAELLAYTHHPWPKTQLLAAALSSLPDTVVFSAIRIARQPPPGQTSAARASGASQEELAKLEPAQRDLKRLQQECDSDVVAITLEGTTTDGIELHRYMDRLNHVPLLDKVALNSLESTNEAEGAKFHFQALLTVRPGFGQPGGPRGQSGPSTQTAEAAVPAPAGLSRESLP